MKLTARRPLYIAGKVETGEFETNEQHGRELIRKGFAKATDGQSDDPPEGPPDANTELEDLRARAAELGIANAGRMREDTLRERIAEAEKAEDEKSEAEGTETDEESGESEDPDADSDQQS